MDATPAEREISQLGEELFAFWASSDLTAASMIGRVTDRIGAPLQSDSDRATSKARTWAARLDSIPLAGLSRASELTRRYLRFEVQKLVEAAELHRFNLLITPYHIGSTLGEAHRHLQALRFGKAADIERYEALLVQYRVFVAGALRNLREQAASGIVVPASALSGCVGIVKGLSNSFGKYLRVAPERFARITNAQRAAFSAHVDRVIEEIRSAFTELCAYVEGDYARQAPERAGLSHYPGGQGAYEKLIWHYSSLQLSAEEVHRRGLDLVAEIEASMACARSQIGFTGSAREFLEHIKADSRFYCRTPEEVGELYLRLLRKFEAVMPQAFGGLKFAPYGVKRLPPEAEGGMTFGYYQPPPAKGERVGYYVYNASNLDQRPVFGAASLIYHELVPGHHLHVSTEMGDETRPPVRRLPTISAFAEGWAEYAADLGFELGLYEDPYDRYGRYLLQAFTASRLVVDTGLNALGWTLQRAREYLFEHSAQSAAEIESEVLRYASGMPGQALAYALGRRHFWQVRQDVERRLGASFDLPAFHEAIIEAGTLPLPDLTFSIEHWAAQRMRPETRDTRL
jgi:uncharacterized protein (DUF885 family)